MAIDGHLDPRLGALEGAIQNSLDAGEDLGLSLAVIAEGEVLANVAAGFQDRAKTLPYTTETLASVFSSGKAVCAALIMAAVSRGELDYEQTVASIWPEFAAEGKGGITLAQALSHQAGLSGFMEPIDPTLWLDWEGTCDAIAALKPQWEPGTASGYSPQIFGFIAGEILRRVTGQGVSAQLKTLTRDVICGLSLSEATRAAPMVKPKAPPNLGDMSPIKKAAFLEKWSSPSGVSRQQWAAAEIPASNMHASAHGLAEVMQLFATGHMGDKLSVTDQARQEAWKERISGQDLVLPFNLSWSAGLIRENGGIFGGSPTAIGHYGFGGSCVMADPAIGLSFAYVPNQQSPALVADPRAIKFIEIVYEALT